MVGGDALLDDAGGNLVWGHERLIALLGVEGLAVIDTPDALLVARLERSGDVRRIVAQLRKAGPPRPASEPRHGAGWTAVAARSGARVGNSDGTSVPVHDSRYAGWLVDSVRSGLVAIDAEGAVAALNAAGQRMLGCARGDPSRADRPRLPRGARRPAGGGASCCSKRSTAPAAESRAELVLDADGGRRRCTIGFTLAPVRDADGRVRGARAPFRDLTPFERGDEQERLRERLAALGADGRRASPTRSAIRSRAWRCSRACCGGASSSSPRSSRSSRAHAPSCARWRRSVTASLEFVRPVALRALPGRSRRAASRSRCARARSRVPFDGDDRARLRRTLPELHADAELLRGVVTNLIVNAFEAMHGQRGPRGSALRARCVSCAVDALGAGRRRGAPRRPSCACARS